ncbi:MAG: Holliday junction branch migration protein RuvA [Coriobacteriia bacterium]|nr:Holliday junction branch migration protein RuvA [Coriobacteriia bacterium]
MIAFLAGTIADKSTDAVTIDVGGIGYLLSVSTGTLASLGAVGDEALLYTHLHLRENEIALYGFAEPAERTAFLALISVSGIGPKVALAVLSALNPQILANAVTTEDVALLSSVSGIGKKTAQRMILELKGKLGATLGAGDLASSGGAAGANATPTAASALAEAQAALFSMGFAPVEVAEALVGADGEDDTSALLKFALHRLGGGA